MALLTLTLGIRCVRCSRVPSYHEQQICVNYSTNCFGKSKSFRTKFENQYSLQFSHYVKGCGTEQTTIAMLFHLDIQESSCKDNAKFKFLRITWESGFLQGSTDFIFQTFRELKIQNLPSHGATSTIYWLHYTPSVLSYSEFGTMLCCCWYSCSRVRTKMKRHHTSSLKIITPQVVLYFFL